MKSLATYERESSENGRATETAWSRRKELVSQWCQTSRDFREVMFEVGDDPEYENCLRRAIGAVGKGADAVRLEAINRMCCLAQEKANAYTGDTLVELEAQRLMEEADERRRGAMR